MQKLFLAIDVGNTTVTLAVMRGQKIMAVEQVIQPKILSEFEPLLRRLKRAYTQIEGVVACSVVPSKTSFIVSRVKRVLNVNPFIIGKDIVVPIRNKYHDPAQVGQDRLVGAYAAKTLYGMPAIIIDFGTAITFDVVSEFGDYEGGMIVPGIQLSLEALFKKTALLPKVECVKIPRSVIGKNTEDSILSGIFQGYGQMCLGLIDLLSKRLVKKPKVIITGGYTQYMKKFINQKVDVIDSNLIYKGLSLLYQSILSSK